MFRLVLAIIIGAILIVGALENPAHSAGSMANPVKVTTGTKVTKTVNNPVTKKVK